MSEAACRIGVDCRDGVYYIARVEHRAERPLVTALHTCDSDSLAACEALHDGQVIVAVPDDLVLVKAVRPDCAGRVDRRKQVFFELSQSLLDPVDDFLLDAFPTGLDGLMLGSAVRRSTLRMAVLDPFAAASGLTDEPACLLRAAALGRGFHRYAVREAGDFHALIDFTGQLVSLCLVHGDQPVSFGHIAADRFDRADQHDCDRLAVELKTLVDFKLMSLFEFGLTLPLAGLVIAGAEEDDPIMAALRKYFSVRISPARFNAGFYAGPVDDDVKPGDLLVALGLAAI